MKKILTASLVAMMAVTAANADIASTDYVDKAKQAAEATATGYNTAMNTRVTSLESDNTKNQGDITKLQADVAAIGGDGGFISTQIAAAVQGLDVDTITVADGKYVKTVSETDGKVSVTTGDLVAQINEDGDNKNDTSTVAPTTAAVAGYVQNKLNVMADDVDIKITDALSETKKNVAGLQLDVASLEENSATKTELSEQNTNLTTAIATAKSEAIETAKGETTSQVSAAKSELQGKIDAVVAGGLTENSVAGTAIKDGTISETQLNTSVNASLDLADSALQKADIVTGTANGTIKVEGVDVAVAGLGTAAYKADTAFDAAGAANTAEANAKAYTDEKVNALDAEAEIVGTNDGSYVTTVAQTDGKIKVSTVAFDTTLNATSTNAVQNKVVNTAIEGIKTNLGGLSGKNIATVPASCAAGGNGTCSLVMKNGVATWEVVEY